MWTSQNITELLLLQNAVVSILRNISQRIDSHSACIIANYIGDQSTLTETYSLRIPEFPVVLSDCHMRNGEFGSFVEQVQQGITIGCSFFIVSQKCALPFLDNFQEMHDWVEQKYEKKLLFVIDTEGTLTFREVMQVLKHRTVMDELPLTKLLQPKFNDKFVDIWSAFPYSSAFERYNRFFLSNFSYEYDKELIPKIENLDGWPVIGALIHYPPYTGYYHVPAGAGNAKYFLSNESLDLQLDGQEHLVLVELCRKYNCTLTGRLDYDESLWGEFFPNHTGTGLIGALATRDANVSCAALYLWDNTYYFTQYSAMLQRATVTHIVPKPQRLPYWQTPILPFHGYIWGYVTSAFLIGAVALFVVNFTQNRIEKGSGYYGLFDSVYAVYMMSIFQGVNINIKFISNIVIFTVILVYALVIGNLYVGGLASVMTITSYEEPINTIEKLVDSKFSWASTALSWIFTLQNSDYPPHKKYVKNYMVCSIQDLLKLVQRRQTAVLLETMQYGTLSYQPIIDKPSSKDYMLMKQEVYWQDTVIMASKTWPFMEQLNRIVFMQMESGIKYYWELTSGYRLMDYDIQRSIEENSKQPEGGEPVRLSIQHVLGALFLWIFGSAVALFVFGLEIVWHRNRIRVSGVLRGFCCKVHGTFKKIYNKCKLQTYGSKRGGMPMNDFHTDSHFRTK